ncbi:MAG TPA: class I SAM-dependent methyltransferase [Candidatus Dormibacteraeota bacterium]|jgi:ubiquinone/menaquinone biosynthesis C-methylase UbiE|nr:class I SAM-dependent methyltransferase [Candidatus Dormibacteraeota bacterium]
MNAFENWFCGTSLWRSITERRILPWMVKGYALGDDVLELGAGLGATTEELRRRAKRVTSLEYDHNFAARLGARFGNKNVGVLQGDAAALPFPDGSFSSVIAVLVLHHLRSQEQQERAFGEIHRVLKPGGVFLALEIGDGWLQRFGHIKSTFVPVVPAAAFARLTSLGFSKIVVDMQRAAFRICALRAREA